MALERELAAFNRVLPTLIGESEGRFALILGEDIKGVFDSYADALQQGYKEAGLDTPFLVKKISIVGDTAHYSRPFAACQA